MFGTDELVQILAGFFGTFGFGILFNIRGRRLLWASIGGLLSWLLFILLSFITQNEVVRYFAVSVLISIYAEIMACLLKTPTTTFCIVSLIPLVPGSALYYSIAYALSGDGANFVSNAVYTLELAASLSMGIVLVAAGVRYITMLTTRRGAQPRSKKHHTS